jgi:hypothetical protein
VYQFDPSGIMTAAIRPNDAIIPMRNGSESFSANSPTFYASEGAGDDVIPADNPTGRDNNHGFEGLTVTGDGNTLYVPLQAAADVFVLSLLTCRPTTIAFSLVTKRIELIQ